LKNFLTSFRNSRRVIWRKPI